MTASEIPEWVLAGNAEDFPEGIKVEKKINDNRILVLRQNDKWHAFQALCPHMSRPLDAARVTGNSMECIWHNMVFNLETGVIEDHSGFFDIPNLKVYKTKIQQGKVYVQV